MNTEENFTLKVERSRSHLEFFFLVFGVPVFIFAISFFSTIKSINWSSFYSSSELHFDIIIFLIILFFTSLRYRRSTRYHILELVQDGNMLHIKYLDRKNEYDYDIDLHKLIMIAQPEGRGGTVSMLILKEYNIGGDKKILVQRAINGWTTELILEVYNRFYKYNPAGNTLYGINNK